MAAPLFAALAPILGGLFNLMNEPEIPEPPKVRKPGPQFIPPQSMAGANMPVDTGASMPMISATPQSQLAALSMFDVDSDDKNPFKARGLA